MEHLEAETDTPTDVDSEDRAPATVGGMRTKDLALLWGLCLLTLATWLFPLAKDPGFSYDDREAIVGNPVVEGDVPLGTAFSQDYWHHLEDAGHYRPMATVLLAMDRARSPSPEPRLFRITNVCLHAGILLMLGLALLRLSARFGIPAPWFGLAVFAVHPLNADVVAWISGRTSLISGLGAAIGLLAMSWVRRGKPAGLAAPFLGTAAGAWLALLGKEDGLVIAAALPLLGLALGGVRAGAACTIGSLVAVGSAAAMRAAALGSALPSSPAPVLDGAGLIDRITMGAGAWWNGLCQLLAPWTSSPPSLEKPDIEPLGAGLWLLAVLVSAILVAGRVARAGDAKSRALGWASVLSLAAILLAVLPLIQLVPAGELFAPRFMYQPLLLGTFFVSWVASTILRPLGPWSGRLQLAAIFALAVLSATKGSSRYQSRLSYWESHLPAHADSPKVWTAIGQARQETGDLSAARAAYLRSIELDETYGAPWAKLGELELRKKDMVLAEAFLRRAIAEDPSAVAARANLGRAVLAAGDPEDAVRIYREAIHIAPGRAALHRGLARALTAAGQFDEASEAIDKALALSPTDPLSMRLRATIQERSQGAR